MNTRPQNRRALTLKRIRGNNTQDIHRHTYDGTCSQGYLKIRSCNKPQAPKDAGCWPIHLLQKVYQQTKEKYY